MGMDLRDIPRAAAGGATGSSERAGFDVRIDHGTHRRFPGMVTTRLSCRRGDDVQVLFWLEEAGEPEYRIYIPSAWGWRASARTRRIRLQTAVTAIIEQAGGHFPSS